MVGKIVGCLSNVSGDNDVWNYGLYFIDVWQRAKHPGDDGNWPVREQFDSNHYHWRV